jgi:hypothetical protein
MKQSNHEIWSKRVLRWKESGLTAKEYAAEMGINASTLNKWQWRLSREAKGESTRANQDRVNPPFVEVFMPIEEASASRPPEAGAGDLANTIAPRVEPLEVVLRDGLCIRVPVHFDVEALRRVVATLEAR